MCRLFGLLSDPPVRATQWLTASDRALLHLANVSPEDRQGDGWGIGWYDAERRTHVEKGIGCADDPQEREEFIAVAERAEGPLVLGHLRKASNPLGLPAEELRALVNSQPFVHGSTLFIHNGAINLPNETLPRTGRYASQVRGINDSEVLFYLLLRHMDETLDPAQAFARTVADLNQVWKMNGGAKPFPYSGLNVVLSRGPHELWAFCLSLGDHGSGLRDESCPYYEMTYFTEPGRVVVASERLDTRRSDWQRLPDGQYLVAQADRGEVKWRTAPIPRLAEIPAS
jgi:predicted glutamine amidotransferase